MPFREKIAWIALVSIVAAFAVYFGMIAVEPHPDRARFVGLFLLVITVQTAITLIASVIVAIANPTDARAPRDERDRSIARQSAGGAYYVLLIGVILAAVTIHLGVDVFWMMNAILAAIMISEAVRFILQIRAYRRGV
jgi:hypothetical protein